MRLLGRVMASSVMVTAMATAMMTWLACKGDDVSTADSAAAHATRPQPRAIDVGPDAPAGPVRFEGKYDSTEGPATLTQDGLKVTIHYKTGHADCTAAESTLLCTWHEGQNYGQAKIVRLEDGKIVGTWGVGASEKSGGEWSFVPVK